MSVVEVTFPGNLAQVDTANDLRGIPSSLLPNGSLYLVVGLGDFFTYDSSSLSTDNGSTVLKPDDKTDLQAGRWVVSADGFAPGPPGPAGPAGPTYTTLAAFKAAPITNERQSLKASGIAYGEFYWTLGDFTGQADNVNVIKADSTPLTTGAWVRQGAASILNANGGSVQTALTRSEGAAFAADWSAFPQLKRRIDQARAAPGTVTIRFVGVGDSNGAGAGVGLAYAPVQLAMEAARDALDPLGDAIWEAINECIPGTIVSQYFEIAPGSGKPFTPAQYVEQLDPAVVVVCYTANDPGVPIYNGALGEPPFYANEKSMLEHIASCDAAGLLFIPPHANVAKSRALDAYGNSALMLHPGIPMIYPTRYFNRGQGEAISFTFDNSNRRMTGPAGFFTSANGAGLSVGKKIHITNPSLDPVTNGGFYEVGAIGPGGDWITLDHNFTLNYVTLQWTDNGNNTLTNGSFNCCVRRVGIDPVTELVPNVNDGWLDYDYAGIGVNVPALTRYLRINDLRRVAATASNAWTSVLNFEPMYFSLVAQYGEDAFYDVNETVHWNINTVEYGGGIRDAFNWFFKSLAASYSENPGVKMLSQRSIVVRPNRDPLSSVTEVNATSSVDIQVKSGDEAVLVRNSNGKKALYQTDEYQPKRYASFFDPGYNVVFQKYDQDAAFIGTDGHYDLAIPDGHLFYGKVMGARNDLGQTIYRVDGVCVGGSVTVTSAVVHDNAALDVMTLSGSGANLRITPEGTSAQSTFLINITYQPLNYVGA